MSQSRLELVALTLLIALGCSTRHGQEAVSVLLSTTMTLTYTRLRSAARHAGCIRLVPSSPGRPDRAQLATCAQASRLLLPCKPSRYQLVPSCLYATQLASTGPSPLSTHRSQRRPPRSPSPGQPGPRGLRRTHLRQRQVKCKNSNYIQGKLKARYTQPCKRHEIHIHEQASNQALRGKSLRGNHKTRDTRDTLLMQGKQQIADPASQAVPSSLAATYPPPCPCRHTSAQRHAWRTCGKECRGQVKQRGRGRALTTALRLP